jgi:hypothetical protein
MHDLKRIGEKVNKKLQMLNINILIIDQFYPTLITKYLPLIHFVSSDLQLLTHKIADNFGPTLTETHITLRS